ncbi:XRE family transcriptional regulator [Oxalobacteraceae bacterium]|nr:XRE family transcriptional regulator [Oxalobacteraceae bacterium]
MAKKFSDLVAATMSPEAILLAGKATKAMREEMVLNELRKARGLSQQALALALNVEQPAITTLERRTDMYISTLRSHIEAMGGALEITAKFPNGDVTIKSFEHPDAVIS